MPEIPRTKFNSPWTVANIEAALNDVASAKGSSESLTAALNAMRAEINSLSGGVHLKGAVDYYNNLPATPSEGDAYTVRYQGTSGTDPLGIEYAWATYQGTPQWIPIGVDPSVFAKQTEMNCVANLCAKNLFINEGQSVTGYGVACTINADGTISLNGTNTDKKCTGSFNIAIAYGQHMRLIDGKRYTLSVDGYQTSDTTLGVYVYTSGLTPEPQWDSYSHQTVAWNTGWNNPNGFRLFIRQGTVVDNLTLKIMIRPAAITDSTFQPYAKTNRELTVLTDEDRAALVEIVDGGAKNWAKIPSQNSASANISFVTQADGGIKVTGTANFQSPYAKIVLTNSPVNQLEMVTVEGKLPDKLAISGLGASTQLSRFVVNLYNGSTWVCAFNSNDVLHDISQYTYDRYNIVLIVPNNKTYNETIYPMICTQTAWKISQTFQPYRPSWQEMWDAIQALKSGGNRALTMQAEPEEQEER